MSEDESFRVPKPVGIVTESPRELLRVYCDLRDAEEEPSDACWHSLATVLPSPDLAVVEDFIRGRLDHTYGRDSGADFWDWLVRRMEAFSRTTEPGRRAVAEAERRNDVLAKMDVTEYAGAVALDEVYASTFVEAMESGRHEDAEEMLSIVCNAVFLKASSARTRTGKQVKVDQARFVFETIARKAAARSGKQARIRAEWCASVAAGLRAAGR